MKTISFLLLTLSLSCAANECNTLPNSLSAYYEVTHQEQNNDKHQTLKPQSVTSQSIELHRDNNRVMKREVAQGINNIWTLNKKRSLSAQVSLNRAFEKYKHIIEYQPNELKYKPQWQDVLQVVNIPALSKMTLVKQEKSGCELEQHYVLKDQENTYKLIWLPALRLVKYFQSKSASFSTQWVLNKYQSDMSEMLSLFKQYDNYQSTDYADVGDNESIPFLAAMINQGFSSSSSNTGHSHAHSEH